MVEVKNFAATEGVTTKSRDFVVNASRAEYENIISPHVQLMIGLINEVLDNVCLCCYLITSKCV